MTLNHDGIDMSCSPLARAKGGLDLCVHCGFCLQACPTYLALEDENDSPRGRIVLMHAVLTGDVAPTDPAVNEHIDRCLGCRGCETACPSGVPFGQLLEATRATLRDHRSTPLMARLLLFVIAQPKLLSIAMGLGRALRQLGVARLLARLPGRMGAPFAMLASTAPGPFSRSRRTAIEPYDTRTSAPAHTAEPVTLFEGCVMRELYGHVHESSHAVLARNGYRLVPAPGQRCCGALHAHSGDLDKTRELARLNIAAFERNSAHRIAVNAAGCGAMLKEYPQLFEHDPEWLSRAIEFSKKVADITELLEERGPKNGAAVTATVAYDAPCHLQHAQRVVSAPLSVFRAIPGLRVVQSQDADKCCGAAGIYNLVQPETSASVFAPKLRDLQAMDPDVVCTGNPGCMMQIGAGLLSAGSRAGVAHPVEILDYSYRLKQSAPPSGPLEG